MLPKRGIGINNMFMKSLAFHPFQHSDQKDLLKIFQCQFIILLFLIFYSRYSIMESRWTVAVFVHYDANENFGFILLFR